ncbi:hypothetical protein CPB84DRAFT_1798821 [Gymnopilus junonius]|uniref:Uncharacterized protein n=1 Tax=Gymnopilus junonius TaxID=109634 RepID=A0A9P5N820_GYMJU|nr:hypothetical protein CPB84DRAFT_1798821 [Gymnopilus junonius]
MTRMHDTLHNIFGDEVASKCSESWGLNEEGESKGCFKDIGIEGLHNIMGDFLSACFYSKTLALHK